MTYMGVSMKSVRYSAIRHLHAVLLLLLLLPAPPALLPPPEACAARHAALVPPLRVLFHAVLSAAWK